MPFTRKSCNNEFGEFSFRHSLSGRWELRALKAKEKKKKMGAFSFLSRVLHSKPSNYSKLLVLVSVRFSFILLFSFLFFPPLILLKMLRFAKISPGFLELPLFFFWLIFLQFSWQFVIRGPHFVNFCLFWVSYSFCGNSDSFPPLFFCS